MVSNAFNQPEWSRHHIHLPVSYQDISVAAKPLNALVLMLIIMVSVEKIAMADHQVEDRVAEPIRFLGVAPEHVIDGSNVVKTGRGLAVAVEVRISAGVGQGFQFISLGNGYHAKVGVAVAAPDFEVQAGGLQSRL